MIDRTDRAYRFESNYNPDERIIVAHVIEDDIGLTKDFKGWKYGLWVKEPETYFYYLIGFDTPYFLQGLISGADWWGMDFRDLIYQYPFDNHGHIYFLYGYEMIPPKIEMIEYPEQPYEKIDDLDDENFIEPLVKDY